MTTASAISSTTKPLSWKVACLGFVVSTVTMTALMVLVGNLI